MDTRLEGLDGKIKKLDAELLSYKQQLAKLPEGPAKARLRQRATRVLQQRKMYEQQKDHIYGAQFNIDQTLYAQETASSTVEMVSAMRSATKVLQKQFKKLKVDDVEDLQDDLADVFQDSVEIQEALGRSYNVDGVTDEELDAELGMLADDLATESDSSYLDEPAVATTATLLTGAAEAGPAAIEEPSEPSLGDSIVSQQQQQQQQRAAVSNPQ